MTMMIHQVTRSNFNCVLPLVADYQRFFNTVPNAEANTRHFSRFLDSQEEGVMFLAEDGGQTPLGFATLYFPYCSILAARYALLNDLFIVKEARRRGLGRALIAHCRSYLQPRGFPTLFWLSGETNRTAHALYTALGATQADCHLFTLPTAKSHTVGKTL